jgi:hypothetical protein
MSTEEQRQVLRDEVANDPKGLGYATHLPASPGLVVDLLNALTDTALGPLRSTTAKAWAAGGPYARIVDASNDAESPCRSSCLVIRESFACGDPIHVEDPELQAMLAVWVQHGVATQAEVDALYARAQQPVSRVTKLGLGDVTILDLIEAGVV